MGKSRASSRATLAFVSNTPDRCYLGSSQSVRQASLTEIDNPGCAVVVLPDRELVFHQFDIQKDLTTDQLAEAVEIRMFQDAGLNPMLEYKTAYTRRASQQDVKMYTVGAIAASIGALENAVSPLTSRLSYVDAMLPTSTLPYALYNANILEPKRDVFVYFQREALVISIFDNGEFIYGKSQDFGIKKLLEAYIQLSGDRMDIGEFIKLLTSANKDDKDAEEQSETTLANLREALSNALFSVKNILLYAGRVSGVTNPDRVFVGTCEGVVEGLEDLAQEILEIEGHEFIFYTSFFSKNDKYVDQIAVLAMLEAQNLTNNLKPNPFNVTSLVRPGAFTERAGGKAVILIAASVIAALAWPLYYVGESLWFDHQAKKELADLGQSRAEFNALQAARVQLQAERDRLTAERQAALDKFNGSMDLLKNIHDKKVLSSPIAYALSQLYDRLTAQGVRVVEITTTGRDATAKIRARRDTQITALLERLARDNYDPQVAKITKVDEGAFSADLKVRLP
ncbi:hypothetical protein FACS1894103_4550 [Campylobacterota bacterium]|nr:hypothetical protein FACS1894103_4550 [Campylobacterota bacterium]